MGIRHPRHSAILAVALLGGCGGYSSDSGYGATTANGTDVQGPTTTPGGEQEDDFLALPPAQTEDYVFVANPARNTVSRVRVATLEVITTPVGADPRVAVVTPDQAQAVIFNRADDSVSLLDVETLDQRVVEVRDDLNVLRLSPDSRHAVLWYDVDAVLPTDPPPSGLQSFNEVSFVDLTTGLHSGMAVGFNPQDVVFTPDGALAAIVSDAFLATVDLTATPLVPRLITLTDALVPPQAEEVVLAPDGTFAWVRQFGTTELLVVDLATEAVTPIPVGTNPTDLDLAPDGATVAVVARDAEELWLFDAADPTLPPRILPLPVGVGYGSLAWAHGSDGALLYTTAAPVDRYAWWDAATDAITEHGLVKPVAGVAMAPEGTGALVFHTLENAPGTPTDDPFFSAPALTVLDVSDHQSNPLLLPAAVRGYTIADDGRYGYFSMFDQKFLEVVDFTTLLHTQIPLKSVPVYVGVLPDPDITDGDRPTAWASQDHDLGRISFWDQDLGELETITGFELNAGIE